MAGFQLFSPDLVENACTLAGFQTLSPHLIEEACTFAGIRREGVAGWNLALADAGRCLGSVYAAIFRKFLRICILFVLRISKIVKSLRLCIFWRPFPESRKEKLKKPA
ncbi:hypothetical protein [Paenibacillus alba]|uniref:Uncharacterized protein n=1 Tax=Paenibacillus alba TaxID=1197127 RepID=A0ABU6G2P9_9BACL|nr:hypothetical protein [Paenibacillus alba]MEC0227860.1 hypothetical protein [Paenibacillus alba]